MYMAGWWWMTFHWEFVQLHMYSKLSSIRKWEFEEKGVGKGEGRGSWLRSTSGWWCLKKQCYLRGAQRGCLSQPLVHCALVQFFSLGKCSEHSRTVPDPQMVAFPQCRSSSSSCLDLKHQECSENTKDSLKKNHILLACWVICLLWRICSLF